MYVRALAGDVWYTAPLQPIAEVLVEKTLVRSLENGLWSVNSVAVPVLPGLVVSFREERDAAFFLEMPHRAARVVVEAGELVTFYEDADAMYFVTQGLAERVNEEEAQALLAVSHRAKANNVLTLENSTTKATKGGKFAAK
jgi:hypothetical protein